MKKNQGICAGLLFILIIACRKPDEPEVLVPAKNIMIEAFVPAQAGEVQPQVYLDARRTDILNGRRALAYRWSLTRFPAGASVKALRDADKALAVLDSPFVTGIYDIELLVQDQANPDQQARVNFTLEILADTLRLYPPVANAGQDTTITKPDDEVQLSGMNTLYANLIDRKYRYKWSVVSQPASSPIVRIQESSSLNSLAGPLVEGVYQFRLEVRDELSRLAYDTVRVTVVPDPYKGTVKQFNDQQWKLLDITNVIWDYVWTSVGIDISDPSFSPKRNETDTEVRVWIDSTQTWTAPNEYSWFCSNDRKMFILYPYDDDEKVYRRELGKKTRVEVRFK